MAPRKDAPSASQTQQDASSEGIEDFELPKLLVTQLAKSALPKDARLEDDTITALVKGSTVFINYLTAAAQDIAASRAHKTISGADVLKALEVLEFGDLVSAFQGELEIFRQGNKAEKGKNKAAAAATADSKGKGKEKASPSVHTPGKSVMTAPPAAEMNQSAREQRAVEADGAKNHVNGGVVPPADVQMRDVREGGDPPANVVKSITLPIE